MEEATVSPEGLGGVRGEINKDNRDISDSGATVITNILIKKKYLRVVYAQKDKICAIFGFKSLIVPTNSLLESNSDCVSIQIISDSCSLSSANDGGEIAKQAQHYIESLAIAEAEDSSYDSDCDNEDLHTTTFSTKNIKDHHHQHQQQLHQQQHHHQHQQQQHEQVSRTTSDTLGQEFAEYVTTVNQSQLLHLQQQQQQQLNTLLSPVISGTLSPTSLSTSTTIISPITSQQQQQQQERTPGYTTRVEFALKLGYTERLVQAALARLGPDPAQNELLAELIKLGAQHGNKGDFACESPTAECLSPVSGSITSLLSPSDIIGGTAGAGGGVGTTTLGAGGIVIGHHHHHHHHHQLLTTSSSYNDDSTTQQQYNGLRPIVIDGSNVAMSHGNKEVFSCRGIKLCVDWFKNRGHKDITVFVPKWRKESSRPDNPIKDQEILNELERERMLVFTPSRLVGGKRMVCYDDRYILKLAVENDGIVVSNDNYRDLVQESSEFKKVVEERVLMYSFVNDRFMPPDDPLGRSGPTLDNFLRIQPKKSDPPPPCPYGKKCTYGNKCKFHHPERGLGPHKSVTERLSEHAARHLSARNSSTTTDSTRIPVQGKSLSVPLSGANEAAATSSDRLTRKALCRTRSGAPDCPSTATSSCSLSSGGGGGGNSGGKQQQQQQQQSPQQGQSQTQQSQQSQIPSWDPSSCHLLDTHVTATAINFPKSHSIENISREVYTHSMVGGGAAGSGAGAGPHHPNYASLWSSTTSQRVPPATSPTMLQQQQSQSIAQSTTEPDESVNLHRKLRRQLTLNPGGCDPRLYQLQRCITPAGSGGAANSTNPLVPPPPPGQSHSPHRPLAPSLSGPRNHHPTQWDLHQSVTRIASAPDPSRPWHSGPPPASSSEPHINLWPHHAPPPVLAAQDQRRRLHYHLASIFPEEQVQTVMQMYPEETNPQTICAAILNMFPKI